MSEHLVGVLAFAVLFAVFGVYGLLRPRNSCNASCGGCPASESCGARKDMGDIP